MNNRIIKLLVRLCYAAISSIKTSQQERQMFNVRVRISAVFLAILLAAIASVATASSQIGQAIRFVVDYNSSLSEWVYWKATASPMFTPYGEVYYSFLSSPGAITPLLSQYETSIPFNADSASLFKVKGFGYRKDYKEPVFFYHDWVRGVCQKGPEIGLEYDGDDVLTIWMKNTTSYTLWYDDGNGSIAIPVGAEFRVVNPTSLSLDFYTTANLTSYLRCASLTFEPNNFPWFNYEVLSAENVHLLPGQSGVVNIDLSDVTGRDAVWVGTEIQYDPSVFRIDSVIGGSLIDNKPVSYTPVNTTTYRMGVYLTEPMTGSGTVFSMQVTAIGPVGNASNIVLVNSILNNNMPELKVQHGSVEIGGQVKISGSVFAQGDLTRPVPNVQVWVSGFPEPQAVTDYKGYFELLTDPGEVSLFFSKVGDNASITIADAALPFLFYMKPEKYPTDTYIMDVNRDRRTDGFDSANIARFYLGKETIGESSVGDWEILGMRVRTYKDLNVGVVSAYLMGEGTGYYPSTAGVASLTEVSANEHPSSAEFESITNGSVVTVTTVISSLGAFALDANFDVGDIKLLNAEVLNANWQLQELIIQEGTFQIIAFGEPTGEVVVELVFDASQNLETVGLAKLLVNERQPEFSLGQISVMPARDNVFLPFVNN